MRYRMRKELDRSNARHFDLKNGVGGIGDIEFLVQYLVLEFAKAHPDVIFYSDNIRQLDALVAAGCLETAVGEELQDCYRAYRLRQHHLAIDDRPPLARAEEFCPERAFVEKIWLEWLDWAVPVLARPFRIEDGDLVIPDEPGTGIEWDEEFVAAHLVG